MKRKKTDYLRLASIPLIIVFTLFWCTNQVNAQEIRWDFVNAAGFMEGDSVGLRWTIGESFATEVSGEAATLRVGFLAISQLESTTSTNYTKDENLKISISPNPANAQIRISVPNTRFKQFRIISVKGETMSQGNIYAQLTMNISDLNAGQYILQIIDPNGTFNTQSFIKL